MLHGNMGQDLISHQPLTELLSQRLPVTLELTVLSMGLAVLLAIPLGVAAARNPGGIVDRLTAGITLLGISVPDFVLGTLLILLFAAALNWLPPQDYVPFSQSPGDNLRHLVLPVIALALAEVAYIAQTTRASMLETLQPGLHHLPARQGHPRGRGGLPACPAQRGGAGGDGGRRAVRRAAGRRDRGGERLLAAGRGQDDRRRRQHAQLSRSCRAACW